MTDPAELGIQLTLDIFEVLLNVTHCFLLFSCKKTLA
jgi:hypothetical protein